jgi:small subunit ribosomal protein S16
MGRKKLPIYKIVAADSRSPRDGRFIESVGEYNPNTNPANIVFKENRIFHWLKSGAKPTDTVRSLLSRNGLLLKWRLKVKGLDEKKIDEELAKWSALQENKLRTQHEKKLKRKTKKKKSSEKKSEEPVVTEETVQAETAPAAGE